MVSSPPFFFCSNFHLSAEVAPRSIWPRRRPSFQRIATASATTQSPSNRDFPVLCAEISQFSANSPELAELAAIRAIFDFDQGNRKLMQIEAAPGVHPA
jgi:hypothetical protein